MKIKWKCLLGAFLVAIISLAGIYFIGQGVLFLTESKLAPSDPVFLARFGVGLLVVTLVGLPTAVFYDLCKDKWH